MSTADVLSKVLVSAKLPVGSRINVDNINTATVVTKSAYIENASPYDVNHVRELNNKQLQYGSAEELVFFRWDPSGIYDWHWEMYCKLLPSSELAKEASNG